MTAPIIALGAGTWRWPEVFGSPRYHLWTLAAAGWPVIYVEPVRSPFQRGKIWSAPDRPFHVVTPNGGVPFALRLAPNRRLARLWCLLANLSLARTAEKAAKKLNLQPEHIWLGSPWHRGIWLRLKTGAQGKCLFHVYDELAQSPLLAPWQQKLMAEFERVAMDDADATLCSSQSQCEDRQAFERTVIHLPNAVPDYYLDQPSCSAAAIPLLKRLCAMPRPRYVYSGVVDIRLDHTYFAALAERIRATGGSLVFLGKLDPNRSPELDSLLNCGAHVVSLGPIPHSELPVLLWEADVCLHAHIGSPFTDGMAPEKINEYLAAGKPIVARRTRELSRRFGGGDPDLIRLTDSPEAFAEAALAAAATPPDSAAFHRRRVEAAHYTWTAISRQLVEVLTS